jgi:photosystem II stability/assembly factor-like uncharacterized protein
MKKQINFYLLAAIIIFHLSASHSQSKFHNPLPAPYQLHGIFFVDPLYGWAVGEFGTIIKTIDGGELGITIIARKINFKKDLFY